MYYFWVARLENTLKIQLYYCIILYYIVFCIILYFVLSNPGLWCVQWRWWQKSPWLAVRSGLLVWWVCVHLWCWSAPPQNPEPQPYHNPPLVPPTTTPLSLRACVPYASILCMVMWHVQVKWGSTHHLKLGASLHVVASPCTSRACFGGCTLSWIVRNLGVYCVGDLCHVVAEHGKCNLLMLLL